MDTHVQSAAIMNGVKTAQTDARVPIAKYVTKQTVVFANQAIQELLVMMILMNARIQLSATRQLLSAKTQKAPPYANVKMVSN